jgi:tRNA(adenine34) deaminase
VLLPEFLDHLMQAALEEARLADQAGEVPVGAVLAHEGSIIARGRNTTEHDKSPLTHAELHAIRKGAELFGNWRLSKTILCVTLEPCTMCLGAIKLARIPTVVIGASDSKQGACGSLFDLSLDDRLGPPVRVIRDVRKDECGDLLRAFFARRR